MSSLAFLVLAVAVQGDTAPQAAGAPAEQKQAENKKKSDARRSARPSPSPSPSPSPAPRVYTDEDLKKYSPKPATPPKSTPAGQAASASGSERSGRSSEGSRSESSEGSRSESEGTRSESSEGSRTGSGEPATADSKEGSWTDSRSRDASQEAAWRARAAERRAAVTAAESEVKSLDEEANRLLWKRIQSTDTNEILQLQEEQAAVMEQLEAARKKLAEAKKALEALESEAARAGVPQGWLRQP